MKKLENGSHLLRFFKFLTTDDPTFRWAVFYSPCVIAAGAFILKRLIRGQSLSESLAASAFIFLLACFVGLVYMALNRRSLR